MATTGEENFLYTFKPCALQNPSIQKQVGVEERTGGSPMAPYTTEYCRKVENEIYISGCSKAKLPVQETPLQYLRLLSFGTTQRIFVNSNSNLSAFSKQHWHQVPPD